MAWEWLMALTMLIGFAGAEPLQDYPIGYEYLDNNETLYVWNQGDIEPNYYYDNDCLAQVTNVYDEQWSLTDKYLGANIMGNWIRYKWVDTGCTRGDDSDFATYVNNSATLTINNVNLKMQSHLGLNDSLITQVYSMSAPILTTFDVWLIFNETNVTVSGDSKNDWLIMQNKSTNEQEYYNLSMIRENGITLNFSSADYYPFYWLKDFETQKSIQNEWWEQYQTENYSWFVEVDGDVNLYVNLGKANATTKYFTKRWVDATCTCSGFGIRAEANASYPNGTVHQVGENWTMRCATQISGLGGGCTGCTVDFWHEYGPFGSIINKTASSKLEILECPSAVSFNCRVKIKAYGLAQWHNSTIDCLRGATLWSTFCKHEEVAGLPINNPSGSTDHTCYTFCNTTYNDGDLNISDDKWCQNEDFKINGSLYVNGSSTLTLNNSNILMNLTFEKIFIEALSKIFIYSNSRLGGGLL